MGIPVTGLPDGQTRCVFVDRDSPASSRRVYATVAGHGVFCSEDGGASWRARNDGLPETSVRALVQHPDAPRTLYALVGDGPADKGGVYRTEDRGLHWHRISGGFSWPDPRALRISSSDPARLYLAAREHWSDESGLSPGGVFASRDGGSTWKRVLADTFIEALAIDPIDPDTVYAGGVDHPYHDDAVGRGVMRSRDGGRTWDCLNTPDLPNRNIVALTIDPHSRTRLYAGTGGDGVYVWEDAPAKVTEVPTPQESPRDATTRGETPAFQSARESRETLLHRGQAGGNVPENESLCLWTTFCQ